MCVGILWDMNGSLRARWSRAASHIRGLGWDGWMDWVSSPCGVSFPTGFPSLWRQWSQGSKEKLPRKLSTFVLSLPLVCMKASHRPTHIWYPHREIVFMPQWVKLQSRFAKKHDTGWRRLCDGLGNVYCARGRGGECFSPESTHLAHWLEPNPRGWVVCKESW